MKGAFVLANDRDLYRQFEAVLGGADGASIGDGAVQVDDPAGLITVFEDPGTSGLDEAREAPMAVRGDASDLDQATAAVCWIECRSEEAFVRWMRLVAARREAPFWVLDGDGVLWSVGALDEMELVL